MSDQIYRDAQMIIDKTIKENLPHESVLEALNRFDIQGGIHMLAIGKAAWSMAKAASDYFGGNRIKSGIVITKYDHSEGKLPNIEIVEAGHPLSDKNTIEGTEKAITLAKSLGESDKLLFLISGGGSALFEKPVEGVTLEDFIDVTDQLLSIGADIVEINTVRKRLSSVKGGKFAALCEPAEIYTVVLSDVIGDRLDSIASGPAVLDQSTSEQAVSIAKKYALKLSDNIWKCLETETPNKINNTRTIVTGSVRTLCVSAAKAAENLGYKPYILSSEIQCEASEAGKFIASMVDEIGKTKYSYQRPCAIICGGETVVRIKGNGLGGRNQELALSAALGIKGIQNILLFSLGSDGTDGPTDAAGGIVDGNTAIKLEKIGMDINEILANNDSYNALKKVDGLIMTGPTGTNVNDVTVLLCK